MIAGVEIENEPRDPDHAPLGGGVGGLSSLGYLCTKFNDSSYSHSRDIIGARKFKIGYMTMTTPLLRVICSPHDRTWYSLLVYRIWLF